MSTAKIEFFSASPAPSSPPKRDRARLPRLTWQQSGAANQRKENPTPMEC